ncbi:unnamed protein product [Brassica oleracea]
MDLRESLRKQNEIVLSLFKHVIATTTAGKPSNRLFSPALINVTLSFIAAKSPRDIEEKILSLLQASSTYELNTVSSKIVTTVLADSTPSGGPTIAAANGVWSEKSVPVDPSFKDIIENSFKFEFGFKATEALEGLGLELPGDVIIHKSCIEVDEVGSKAAAAAAVISKGCRMPPTPKEKYDFVADHPFLFLVKENFSGLVLFLGQVTDPSMH